MSEHPDVERAVQRVAERAGLKKGTEILQIYANLLSGLSSFFQPHPAGTLPNPNQDLNEFYRWSKLACDVAAKLAVYESARPVPERPELVFQPSAQVNVAVNAAPKGFDFAG